MKLTFLLTVINVMVVMGTGFSQSAKVTLNLQNSTLREVFLEIENQTDFSFLFKADAINQNQKVDIQASGLPLNEVLSTLFKDKNIQYQVLDNSLIVLLPASGGQSQQFKISGRVTDATSDEAVIGANIIIEGTTVGVVTDVNGKFVLDLPKPDAILVISYLGYNTERMAVNGQSTIDIKLVPDIKKLDEVVIVGYGTQKRSDLTGAVSSIKLEDKLSLGASSVERFIQGNASGVEVINSDGLPGSAPSVKIRGVGTFGNSEPLYVVDGIVFFNERSYGEANPLSLINPGDIESVEILKDAATASIYGARAANGVILITTKKGQTGKPKINFSSNYGFAKPWKFYEVLNAEQYVELAKDIYGASNLKPRLASDYAKETRTDWQDEIMQTAPWMNGELSFAGGTENFKYYSSFNYTDQVGTIKNYNFNRISFRLNTETKVSERVRIGENITVAQVKTKDTKASLREAIRSAPYMPVYDSNNLGGYSNMDQNEDLVGINNQVAFANLYNDEQMNFRIMGNVFADIEIAKGLVYRSSFNLDLNTRTREVFNDKFISGGMYFPTLLNEKYDFGYNYLWDNTLNYAKVINNHSFQVLLGSSFMQEKGRKIDLSGSGFANNLIESLTVADPSQIAVNQTQGATGPYHDAMLSVFGRLSYTFKNKYLLNANFRRDGSSRFSEKYRWGNFPSISAGWKIHEEEFMKGIDFISNLKIRGSWGKSGNDRIRLYQQYALVHQNNIIYPLGATPTINYGATVRDLASDGLKWEETTSYGIGIDVGLIRNKLDFTIDFFNRETDDILINVPIPPSVGAGPGRSDFGKPFINAASVGNKGIEFSGKYRDMIKKFGYSLFGNLTFVKNEVLALNKDVTYIQSDITRSMIGQPIGGFYVYKFDKVYSTQAEVVADNEAAKKLGNAYYDSRNKGKSVAGDIRWADLDGDGTITDKDRTILGNGMPDLVYSFGGEMSYAGFDLSFQMYGVYGNELYNDGYRKLMESNVISNKPVAILDRWRKEGDITNIPRAVEKDPAINNRESSYWIEDGSYLRLKNVTLGYTFNLKNRGIKKHIEGLHLYVTGQNLFTFTKYRGMDPEVGYENEIIRGKDSSNKIPQPKVYLFGVKASF